MKKPAGGLGRQIVLSTVISTVASVLITIIGLYIFYGVIIRVAPHMLFPLTDDWRPHGIEWLLIGLFCVVSTGIAVLVATRLARRIVQPLVSVAQTARIIADGNIKVRARSDDRAPTEATMLVEDFNLLADRLEQAGEAVRRWNATIAHELRTPVTILSGRLQGLADGVFAPDPPLLRSLVTQVNALTRLIEDLRTVSLMEGGRLDMRFQQVDLAEEMETVVRLMQPELETAGFRIVTAFDRGLCYVDTARIRQALMALLENAHRHADPGQLAVTLRISSSSVLLSVTDEGPGMTEEFARHAFDPFRRYMEQGGAAKGSGLGLSVVRGIAEAHGGAATYRTVNGGSCFTLTLSRWKPRGPSASTQGDLD
ncbi:MULTISPECIES: ATP-binding protein [unclassified Sphingobium]|uniref:ATP-binding protein n=1 Tax=unclassified Sphingobium TaxID=2611147 RepID=UPI0022249BAE|nr:MULTISPECIES: ATP-binding protein [unclassified Sphingobium]MCW2382096.1 two-component system sensor histidine kinase AdeS [Sphingobium sp. B2D3B]MCW2397724.1 two-component system sensor histidine kinase AdeS [Sphingobium sp. B2D3C]